jgi:hypothetical protein
MRLAEMRVKVVVLENASVGSAYWALGGLFTIK